MNSGVLDKGLPSKWSSFMLQNLTFVHRPEAIQYFISHNIALNQICAYFKNVCLKLNFDKCENQNSHWSLMEQNLTLDNEIIHLGLQNWRSARSNINQRYLPSMHKYTHECKVRHSIDCNASLSQQLSKVFKKITTFFNFKTCFTVAIIIVSCKIFEKLLGLYNN